MNRLLMLLCATVLMTGLPLGESQADDLDLLDQRQYVPHAENSGSHPIRMKDLKRVYLFTDAHESNRLSGDLAYRQRDTAFRIAIGLCQHNTGE